MKIAMLMTKVRMCAVGRGDSMIEIIAAILGSGALTTIVSALVTRHYNKVDKKEEEQQDKEEELIVMREALEVLVHDRYHGYAKHLIRKDTITEDELENHNYLYRAYKSLGLNDTGDALHHQVLTKEVIYYD